MSTAHRPSAMHEVVGERRERLRESVGDGRERLRESVEDGRERLREGVELIKPHLRGWLHACTFPVALAAGVVLFAMSPTTATRIGSGVFAVTALLLFGCSALFHRGRWSPRAFDALRRLDHANIFLLIAGTYTPFGLLLLEGAERRTMLLLVWGAALAGIAFRVLWLGAPRCVYVPVYVAMGSASVFWMGDFAANARTGVFILIVVGGALYSIGGLVYGLRRPNPLPRWFGFHEVFHSLTIIAFAAHYAGVSIATYSLR